MGIDQDKLEMEHTENFEFCISMTVRNRLNNFRWLMLTVYGPAHHDRSLDFLEELYNICKEAVLPIIVGGDFNLIREESNKNSDNINYNLMDHFNRVIGDL